MRLIGDHEGRRWRIGIQHPRRTDALLATLDLADCAVVTSGDYERYFERDGVRYHHLFDPRSGRPARLCQAVTVVAPQAALADALATATFVLGPEKGLELLRGYPGVEGLIVAADGSSVTTDGLGGRVQWR
jgi:thiamine biosynthesis lipoprotein